MGGELGRAISHRANAYRETFKLSEMLDVGEGRKQTRYPKGLTDWRGFLDAADSRPGAPFDFRKYVVNFRNFRGVGGGIHFGTHAEPDDDATVKLHAGAHLNYDASTRMIALSLRSGEVYEYGPVEPRVLKALFSFVTSYPGINLAVTVGATGDTEFRREDGQSPILLDPSFVDTPVGQALYLADTLPWSLDEKTLPNGAKNPISETFAKAKASEYESAASTRTDALTALISDVEPLSGMSRSDAMKLVPDRPASKPLKLLTGAGTLEEFKRHVEEQELDDFSHSDLFKENYEAISNGADALKAQGMTPKEIEIAVLFSGGIDRNIIRLRILSAGILSGNRVAAERVARLAEIIGPEELPMMQAVAAYMKAPVDRRRTAMIEHFFPKSERERSVAEWVSRFKHFYAPGTDWADRVRAAIQLAAHRSNAKIVVPKSALRLAAAALQDQHPDLPIRTIAEALPREFRRDNGLAVLFDRGSSFGLEGGVLKLSVDLQYRYAVSDYRVEGESLVFLVDDHDPKSPALSQDLERMSVIATNGLPEIAKNFAPVSKVASFAKLAAFLRWAACTPASTDTCQMQKGLSIDFSSLGQYALRDREATPTPDAELR